MKINRFIVIDDDPLNNAICKVFIKKLYGEAEIQTFTDPEAGFSFISSASSTRGNKMIDILLLDINMPTWTGWDFLDHFDKLNEKLKKKIKIFILSSSIDVRDRERAEKNRYVFDYIVKPITPKALSDSVDRLEQMGMP